MTLKKIVLLVVTVAVVLAVAIWAGTQFLGNDNAGSVTAESSSTATQSGSIRADSNSAPGTPDSNGASGTATVPPPDARGLVLTAQNMADSSGVQKADDTYAAMFGTGTLIDRGATVPDGDYRSASWQISNIKPGRYKVELAYAAGDPRPLQLLLNDRVVLDKIAAETTGGYSEADRKTIEAGEVTVTDSSAVVQLRSSLPQSSWPVFKELHLIPEGE
jgi:hypothetical protein